MTILKKINIKKAVTHNLLLKLVSLGIAIILWLYFSRMITGGGMSI